MHHIKKLSKRITVAVIATVGVVFLGAAAAAIGEGALTRRPA